MNTQVDYAEDKWFVCLFAYINKIIYKILFSWRNEACIRFFIRERLYRPFRRISAYIHRKSEYPYTKRLSKRQLKRKEIFEDFVGRKVTDDEFKYFYLDEYWRWDVKEEDRTYDR